MMPTMEVIVANEATSRLFEKPNKMKYTGNVEAVEDRSSEFKTQSPRTKIVRWVDEVLGCSLSTVVGVASLDLSLSPGKRLISVTDMKKQRMRHSKRRRMELTSRPTTLDEVEHDPKSLEAIKAELKRMESKIMSAARLELSLLNKSKKVREQCLRLSDQCGKAKLRLGSSDDRGAIIPAL